ncbi:PAS domain S-box protein, partial [Fulvivirga sp. RKSG066]|uniref:PAS domain S-box protein n=1 Tax=Fulvivirga aurantia TaxID=2529383 RepID=UPI0012BC7059
MPRSKNQTPDFKEIVETLNDMIYELDNDGRFYYANSTLEKISGYSKEELKSIHYWDLVKEEQKEELKAFYYNQRKKQIEDTYYEFIMITKSGKQVWIGQNVKMIYKSKGVVAVRAVARDITKLRNLRIAFERKAKELEKVNESQALAKKDLEEKNALMDLILNTMTDAVVVLDAKGDFILFNEASKNIAGKDKTDKPSSEWPEHYGLYYPDKETMIETKDLPMMLSLQGKEVYNFESYVKNDDNEGVFVRVNTRPLRDNDGNIIGALVVSTNINEQKEAEIKLRASEEKFRAMSDASPLGIFVTDNKGSCEYTNTEYQKQSGLSFEEALGDGWTKAIHPDDTDRVFKEWTEAVKKEEVFSTEQRFKHKDGTVLWSTVKASAMIVNDKTIGYVGTVEDITTRKQYEERLLEAKEEAEMASKAKEDFLSTMSHEIRTPLNAVIGMAHLLQDEDPLPHQIENLNALRFSADNLLVLINDILDYNKIESGKVTFEKIEVDLKHLISRIRKSLLLKAQEKGIRFNAIFDSDIPDVVMTDPVRLNQIITNLLSNAIKFTENGFVKVEVLLEEEDEATATVSFLIKDSGIGIPKDQQDKIFDRFSQAEKTTTRIYGGTGLGLAITKKLVELQGGNIELRSESNKGSEFSFTLTFDKGRVKPKHQEDAEQEVFPSNLSGTKILVVEDNQINQVVAEKFLRKWNISVEIANHGKEALEILKKESFDLVLMDLQMPVMGGYEATAEMKADKSLKDLPIIALTASALTEERERVFKSGMNDFVTKPLNAQELYSKIAKIVGKSKAVTTKAVSTNGKKKDLIDSTKVEEMAEGDMAFLTRMYKSYLVELGKLEEAYIDIVKNNDMDLYRATRHKTIASIDLFNADELKAEVMRTEKLLSDKNTDGLKANLKSLQTL